VEPLVADLALGRLEPVLPVLLLLRLDADFVRDVLAVAADLPRPVDAFVPDEDLLPDALAPDEDLLPEVLLPSADLEPEDVVEAFVPPADLVPPDAFVPPVADAVVFPVFPPVADASSDCPPRGWVSQATAAPVRATGHSTRPAAPSTPAPVYTAMRLPRGDTMPTLSSAPSAALPTVPAPGTFRSAEAAVSSGAATVRNGAGRGVDDCCCLAMTHSPRVPSLRPAGFP
jgi:hypothetical protein